MKITVLSENHKSDLCDSESGLSLYVEFEDHKFLFDTGNSNLFLKNAKKLDIDVDEVDTVILSHGHADHSNGLEYLTKGKRVIMHPSGFKDRFSIRRRDFAGFPMSEELAKTKFNFELTKEPLEVLPKVWFLGEVPRITKFENIGNISTCLDASCDELDPIEDDSGIVIKTDLGLIILSGCGHSGICNTIEHAKNITGEQRVYAVLGGFHLVVPTFGKDDLNELDDIVDNTIEYFKSNKIRHVILGHCIAETIIDKFKNGLEEIVQIHRMYCGAIIEL